jgi:hypothetical protein
MLNINSVEQQVRKHAEVPVISWSDDCECKQKVSAVTDLLKKFIITEKDARKSKPEATSSTNTRVKLNTYLLLAPRLRVDRDIYLLLLRSLIPWARESLPF